MIDELYINSVASYTSPSTITPTNKTSLFYGLNGAGKSTISSFLYDQQSPIYAHCKITQSQGCEVLVYNQDFLNEYFYEGDSLKGIFTLSKENKAVLQSVEQESKALEELRKTNQAAQEKIKEIESRKEQEKTRASSKIWEIKTKYSGGDRVLEFCLEGLKRTELLFKHVSALPLPSQAPDYSVDDLKTETSLVLSEGAAPLPPIQNLKPDWLGVETNELFEKVIVGSQEGSVAEFISKLGNSDWVKVGLKYLPPHVDQEIYNCPFCQSPTITKSVADSIRDVFDQAYELDISKLEKLKSDYTFYETNLSLPSVANLSVLNKELEDAWKLETEVLKAAFRENSLLIDGKLKSPSTPIKLKGSEVTTFAINEIIGKLNELIEEHNDKIANKRRTVDNIKGKFWSLMRWDYAQTIFACELACAELDEELKVASQEALDAANSIQQSTKKIAELRKQTVNIEEAIQNINGSLLEIGIDGFSVVKHSDSLYRIARGGAESNAFHSLSEGEKTVISFLYFIELCKGQKTADSVPKKKIVAIDDPISSLSHLYVFNIGQLIKRCFINDAKYEQVFVFTHSLYFFYELTHTNKETRDQTQKLFRIIKNANGSSVIPMKYEEIQNDYQSYWSIVKDASAPPALIANCMRNIIEYFFNFVQKKDFNNVFQKPVLSADKFKVFYRYMNRGSHSLGQNIFDIKEFDYQVFKDGLKTIFDECGYLDHYNAMMK